MDYNFFKKYKEEQHVEDYHGFLELDCLRHMSSLQNIPQSLSDYYNQQYVESFKTLDISSVRNFGENLFYFLNGNELPIIKEVINTTSFMEVELRALRIEVPYFIRANEYFDKWGYCFHIQSEYEIIDLVHNGFSVFEEFIKLEQKKPSHTESNYSKKTPFILNSCQYGILNSFVKPYNGIGAVSCISICRDLKSNNYGYRSNGITEINEAKREYVNRAILGSLRYCIGEEIFNKTRILSDKEIREQVMDVYF